MPLGALMLSYLVPACLIVSAGWLLGKVRASDNRAMFVLAIPLLARVFWTDISGDNHPGLWFIGMSVVIWVCGVGSFAINRSLQPDWYRP